MSRHAAACAAADKSEPDAAGRTLLGCEPAHVIQQRAGRVRNSFGSGIAPSCRTISSNAKPTSWIAAPPDPEQCRAALR
jgi:hypothetical protein